MRILAMKAPWPAVRLDLGGFWLWLRRRCVLFRKKWPAEHLEKIVAILKVLARILRGLGQEIALDHVEDQLAEILAALDAPFIEHHLRHGAELLQGVLADAHQQFLASHV